MSRGQEEEKATCVAVCSVLQCVGVCCSVKGAGGGEVHAALVFRCRVAVCMYTYA